MVGAQGVQEEERDVWFCFYGEFCFFSLFAVLRLSVQYFDKAQM